MGLVLGLDAGGTKTFCLVGDDSGGVRGFGRAKTGNYEGYGVEAAAAEISKAVHAALADAGAKLSDIEGIGMGVAGADLPEDYVMLEQEIFGPLFGETPRVFRNDSMAGLRGGTREPFGIVISCGTGCVCAGITRDGVEGRIGGISEEFGDRVSGSSIGLEGLRAVWRARDGVTGPTLLTELFVQRAGCQDADEFFLKVYRREISEEALQPMAKLVFDAALEGDAIACDILEWGGDYLGDMVNACAQKIGMTREHFDVVMAGSVFKGLSPVLIDAMTTRIHRVCPSARPVKPIYEPVVGAFLLGVELTATMDDSRYENLDATLDVLAERHQVHLRTG